MDLFDKQMSEPRNLLPQDGDVRYYGPVMSLHDATYYFDRLLKTIAWKHDKAIIFGKKIITKRKVSWYGDQPFSYEYSKTTKIALPWTEDLLSLKKITEQGTGQSYNSCLLNLYHSGEEGMAWHSDAEKDLKKNGSIGSLSFGAERKFSFKHKQNKTTVSQALEHGSLLEMKGTTQTHWLHRLPPTKTITNSRINLTFRTITEDM